MRKCVAAILFLLMSASLALSIQKPDEWIAYTSPEGRYSVSLPAKPTLSTQEATSANGEKFPQYLASVVKPDDVAFMIIGYFDTMPGTIFSADAARDGMVKGINGTLISETTISLGGYPGRELKISAKPVPAEPAEGAKPAEAVEYTLRARFYEVDKRVYLLQFIFPKSLESETMSVKGRKVFRFVSGGEKLGSNVPQGVSLPRKLTVCVTIGRTLQSAPQVITNQCRIEITNTFAPRSRCSSC